MPNSLNQLLRRTFIVAAAMAAIAAVPTAHAGQVKTDTGTIFCTGFSGINVDPNGGLAISGCTTTPTPPTPTTAGPAGAFDFSLNTTLYPNAALTLYPADYTNLLSIIRTGGTTGGVTVSFTRSGGCGPLPLDDTATFANGQTSATVDMRTPNNNATCKATITKVAATDATATAPPTIGTGMPVATMTVSPTGTPPKTGGTTTTGGGGGGTTVAGCPAMDPNNTRQVTDLVLSGVARYLAPSGMIMYEKLPDPLSSAGFGAGTVSGKVQFNDSTATPSAGTKEIWISKCPGVLDPNVDTSNTNATPGRCYISDSTLGTTTAIDFFTAPGAVPSTTDSTANSYNICEAYSSNGPWYINFRWTYNNATDCQWGLGACGFTGQLNYSGFTP